PKHINLYVDFEYLSETKINYNDLRAQANIYQYFGYYKEGSAHPPRSANGKGYTDFSFDYKEYKYDDCDLCGGTGTYYSRTCPRCDGSGHINGHWEDRHYSDTVSVSAGASGYSVHVIQPYIQMGEEPVQSLTGQPLTAALEGSRTYTIHEISTPIDLTFELGGTVWVDGTAGKESNFDGLYNTATDTPMSNVKVTLYRKNGEKVAETRTDKNGKYLFEHQNAMYQYYIKFTYNGQYYEPTIYNVDRDSENWNITSKGLDILSENYISIAPDSDTTKVLDRDSFNIRFQEIGSNPLNVNGMEVYTRDELYEKGYIDEFGNLTDNVPSEYAKYVEYCMMDSYTCNATTVMDLYPGFTIFVVDDYLNKFTANTKEVLTFIGTTKIEILYGNPDVMHYINQGYVLREEFDLAVKKDVFNATLEINGKTQVYAYDKRQANENGDWEIQARLSDAYYDATYSREIYREDYEYKADDYVSSGLNSGFDANAAGVSQDKELKVYVTYKLTIRNQSETLAGRVTEIVDYYDQEYTFVPERTYLGDKNGNRIEGYTITGNEHSIYGTQTETTISGYKNVYLTGMEDVLLDPDINKDCYIYVTFLVNKDSNRNIILDEELSDATPIGVGKENIAEINGYKTFYGSKSHAPNENNPATTPEYYGSQYDTNNNLIKQGDIAGKVDRDSVPGNLNPTDVPKDDATGVQYENFEDDTDKAPNIRIILNRENSRTVDGTVWEDKRNVTEASAQVGDGIRDSVDEPGVNGVRVQLVELLENDQEYIWKEVNSGDIIWQDLIIDNSGILKDAKGNYVEHSYSISTYDNPENDDGQYIFKSFVPGNYIVRFIYGDGTSSVLGAKSTDYNTGATIDNPVTNLIEGAIGYNKTSQAQGYDSATENLALNDKSYNGQDYKSTTYQYNINNKQGVNNGKSAYENTESKTYTYNFSEADGQLYSDAKDIWIRRQEVASYSTENVTNHKAEVLASFERIPEYNGTSYDETAMESLLNEFLLNTYMIAETGVIDVNFEYNRPDSETSQSGYDNIGSSNYEMSGYYNIANLDFGLQERPKAQLKITKQVTNVRVTLANGSILFDASGRATNVLWNSHTAHDQDTENKYTISTNYDNNFMKVPKVREDAKNKGLIQLTMDEELMHGATIQVTYAITVANIGEVDYDEPKFYYTGSVANTSTLVKTTPNTLIDYVGFQAESGNVTRNNLQFNASQNPDWSVISVDDLVNNNLINSNLRANADAYTTIVKTDTVGTKALKPIIMDEDNAKKIDGAFNSDPLNALDTVNSSESVVGVQLVLSQMITSDNSSDDMTYNNLVEIVKTSNPVGRRMAYSVVGNQDPTKEPAEIDADDSQEITILPPFGQSHIYYVLGGAVALILIAGIALVIGVVRKID
ncbi:MAG: SdrD B-like domain-containing protein, partial [Clostridia bacterium]